jgi:hypothetical protein
MRLLRRSTKQGYAETGRLTAVNRQVPLAQSLSEVVTMHNIHFTARRGIITAKRSAGSLGSDCHVPA